MTTVMGQSVPAGSYAERAMISEEKLSGVAFDVVGDEKREYLTDLLMQGILNALDTVRETDRYSELARATDPNLQTIMKMNSAILCAAKKIVHVATACPFPVDIAGGIWRGRDKRNNSQWAIVNGLVVPQTGQNSSEPNTSHWLITQEQKRK